MSRLGEWSSSALDPPSSAMESLDGRAEHWKLEAENAELVKKLEATEKRLRDVEAHTLRTAAAVCNELSTRPSSSNQPANPPSTAFESKLAALNAKHGNEAPLGGAADESMQAHTRNHCLTSSDLTASCPTPVDRRSHQCDPRGTCSKNCRARAGHAQMVTASTQL